VAEKYRIVWAPTAVSDLDGILNYIAARSGPDAALGVFSKMAKRIDTLSHQPLHCRIVPELKENGIRDYRELIVTPYRVFFQLRGKSVGIVGILDARRDLEEILINRALD
jgi:toxin ParE1/3/4